MSHETPTIEAHPRQKTGSRYAYRLREEGHIPAVVYGHGEGPTHVSLNLHEFTLIVNHQAHLIELTLDGKKEPCLIKDLQYDYLGKEIIHADFTRVDLTEEVELEVELVLQGEPKALTVAGAVLQHPHTVLKIACKANAIPEHIDLDISELTADHPITVADVPTIDGVRILDDAETILASITVVQEVSDEELAEAGSDEPEVIKKDKAEEEGDE